MLLDASPLFLSRPRPRINFFVFKVPRDEDFGLEDYTTATCTISSWKDNKKHQSTNIFKLPKMLESARSTGGG